LGTPTMFDAIRQQLLDWVTAAGLDVQQAKLFSESHGLGALWELARDLYLNPYVMLLVLPLWFALGWFRPAADRSDGRRRAPHVALDFIYPILCIPIQVTIAVATIALIQRTFETWLPFLSTGLLDDQPIAVQALGAFLITDFMFYVAHWLKHKVPWLWYFHAVHHSQRYVNPLTTLRNHPFEGVINAAIKTVPIAMIGGSYPAFALFVFFNNMWGYFIHADVRINWGPIKYVLVTPQNHRFHHTIEPALIDRNFGERLTLWDWMFGTLHTGFDDYTATGVPGCEWIEETSTTPHGLVAAWARQMVFPFWMIGADIARYFRTRLALRV
jgi:sterol desaturase/sphingolipid hydroxylase (fatty acid hydroxylase superfamily)